MDAQRTPKKRSAAWRRSMEDARQQAVTMLDRIGPNSDHLPEQARKEHKKMTADLERIVEVIDRHLSDAQPAAPSRSATAAGSSRARSRSRTR